MTITNTVKILNDYFCWLSVCKSFLNCDKEKCVCMNIMKHLIIIIQFVLRIINDQINKEIGYIL